MKAVFNVSVGLLVLALAACEQRPSPEPSLGQNGKGDHDHDCAVVLEVTDALPTPSIEALSAGVCYKIGIYSFDAKLTQRGANASLQLTVSPFQGYKTTKWFLARAWNRWDDIDETNVNQLNKSWFHRDLAVVFDQSTQFKDSLQSDSLTFELRTDDFDGWGHLILIHNPASKILREVFLKPLIAAYESQLTNLLATSPVKEVAWFNVLREIPKADTLAEIGRAYVKRYLNPTFLGYDGTSDYLTRVFAGEQLPYFQLVNSLPALDKHPLIVVHTAASFDGEQAAKEGADQLVARFKDRGLPVVYLVDSAMDHTWYLEDWQPTHAYFSAGGEHDLMLEGTNEVTVVGGFFGDSNMESGCQHRAWLDFIYNYFEMGQQASPLVINMYLPAMYFYDDDGFTQSVASFAGLHVSEHMQTDGDNDALPHTQYTPRILRDDYDWQYYHNGELKETYDNGAGKLVLIKFWDALPQTFP